MFTDKAKVALNTVLTAFKNGTIPDAIAFSCYPRMDVPSNNWSFLNRTLMFISGTADARGFKQWAAANRHVKKGAKAIYILAPSFRKMEDEEQNERKVLTGFRSVPVYRQEDTDGEPLDYQQIELPALPFMERAQEWGLAVRAIPGNCRYYGYFSQDRQEIALATPEEKVFFHELAHAGHARIRRLKGGQDPFQEIVAELSAQALCHLIGKTDTLGNSYRYIEEYARKAKMTAVNACLWVLDEVEQVLKLVLAGGNGQDKKEAGHG